MENVDSMKKEDLEQSVINMIDSERMRKTDKQTIFDYLSREDISLKGRRPSAPMNPNGNPIISYVPNYRNRMADYLGIKRSDLNTYPVRVLETLADFAEERVKSSQYDA